MMLPYFRPSHFYRHFVWTCKLERERCNNKKTHKNCSLILWTCVAHNAPLVSLYLIQMETFYAGFLHCEINTLRLTLCTLKKHRMNGKKGFLIKRTAVHEFLSWNIILNSCELITKYSCRLLVLDKVCSGCRRIIV